MHFSVLGNNDEYEIQQRQLFALYFFITVKSKAKYSMQLLATLEAKLKAVSNHVSMVPYI